MPYDFFPRVWDPCSPPFSDVSQHLAESQCVSKTSVIVGDLLPFDRVCRIDGEKAGAFFDCILV